VVLLHYRVVPGLGATPPPPPTPVPEQHAVPVSNPITLTDPAAASVTQVDVEEPCDCPGVTVAAAA